MKTILSGSNCGAMPGRRPFANAALCSGGSFAIASMSRTPRRPYEVPDALAEGP
jgi:hypothetical protein